MNIQQQLDELANLQAQAEVIRLQFAQLRKAIMPAEIQAQLDDLEAEQASTLEPVQNEIATLTDDIKGNVIIQGISVKGSFLMAVFNKARVTWDGKILEGYAVAHPEINAAKKVGEPSVSIRSIK